MKFFNCEDDKISPSVLGVGRIILPGLSVKDCTDKVEGIEYAVRLEETENRLLLLLTTFEESVHCERWENKEILILHVYHFTENESVTNKEKFPFRTTQTENNDTHLAKNVPSLLHRI